MNEIRVKDLIRKLQQFDDNAKIVLFGSAIDDFVDAIDLIVVQDNEWHDVVNANFIDNDIHTIHLEED